MEKHPSTRLGIILFAIALAIYLLGLALASSLLGLAFALPTRSTTVLAEGVFPLSLLLYAAIGALIIARRPNLIGWIFYAMGLSWSLRELAIAASVYVSQLAPAFFQASALAFGLLLNAWVVSFGLVPLLFILFPDGQVRSRTERLAVLVTGLAVLNGLLTADPSFAGNAGTIALPIPGSLFGLPITPDAADSFQGISGMAFMVLYIWAALSLVIRLRRARRVQQLQLKWLAYAGLFFAFVVVLIFIPEYVDQLAWLIAGAPYPALMLWGIPFGLALLAVPVASSIAIFRYRLYDIDVIIRRTLIYGALTALLAFIYFGTVVILQGSLRALTGQTSDLAVVGSTLVIAALFAPLRNGIQRLIDRRLYRSKYDAALVLSNFGTTVRDEVDIDRLRGELISAVQDTMEPASLTLWLRRVQ